MRETKFIQQMHEKWRSFEELLKQPSNRADRLYDVFIEVMNDLSYAKTFYANRSVRVYLNGLAQRIFVDVHKNRKSQWSLFADFWLEDLPRVLWETRKALLVAFLVFLGGFLIGMLSSAMDEQFANTILGDMYVAMTEANIEKGDPMAVYKDQEAFGMSLGIAGNNLYVATLTFVMGVFYTIGSLLILVSNAIMVGTFQFFFIERGLFLESFLTIWIHGTLEISAIIIAGAAGIVMGQGLVFPGSYSRMKSFQRSARRGLKIMIGIAPIIILTAFYEGFLTRQTELPDAVRGLFILVNLALVLGYFIWYPWWKAKHTPDFRSRQSELTPEQPSQIDWYVIKPTSQLLGDGILVFRKQFGAILWAAILATALYAGLVYFLANDFTADFRSLVPTTFFEYFFGHIRRLPQYFINANWWMIFAMLLAMGSFVAVVLKRLSPQTSVRSLLLSVPVFLGTFGLLYLFIGQSRWWILFALPIFFVYLYAVYEQTDRHTPGLSFANWLNIGYFKSLSLFLFLIGISIAILTLFHSGVSSLLMMGLSWIFPFSQATLDIIDIFILIFLDVVALFLSLGLILTCYKVLYFSILEQKEAVYLKEQIQSIGTTQRIKGLEREA
ncbi:MAG: stage II sporulation protein M [Bacteroidota bacterium]